MSSGYQFKERCGVYLFPRQAFPMTCYHAFMSPERHYPGEGFGLTEHEQLYEHINHKRFLALLTDSETNVHHIDMSTNSFGEFLFVTMSRPVGEERSFLTFWGAGLHELRERWLTNEWRFYETQQFSHQIPQK